MALFDAVLNPSLRFSFMPTDQHIALKLAPQDVKGFADTPEPSQDDADAVSAKLEELHASLTPAQQSVLAQLIQQAGS